MKVLISPAILTALIFVSLGSVPAISVAQSGAVRARVTEAVSLQDRVTLRGNIHPLARPEFDQGVAPDNLPMQRMLLVLQRGQDQEVALRQLLDEQQISSSPQFHQWLTPEQFGQQFGPADADIQAVTDWLASQGFEVTKIAAGRTVIEFSGTAGLVRQALGTEIHKFRVNDEDHWANASDPQIPAALAPVVAGFASLNNFPRRPMYHSLGTFSRSKATGAVQPLFTYPTSCRSGSGPCYYFTVGPADFATIYNVAPLWSAGTDGTGQTIAVVGETNINPQDVADFRLMFGLPANQPNIILNGPNPGITSTGEEGEADLDVQWTGAVAKGASIDFVVSQSTETTAGIDLSALYIIDNDLAPIMSESYGSCEAYLGAAGNQFYSTLWEQAAAQGITVLLAAGDSGSAGCDYYTEGEAQYGLAVSGLASTPFNVAVGGTDFNDANNPTTYWNTANTSPSEASAKSYIPESTWNDSCAASGSLTGCSPPPSSTYLSDGLYLLAGSGGPSNCTVSSGVFPNVTCSGKYAKPSWQSGPGVPSDSARDIPDVSMFAGNGLNYSFYVICQMDANNNNGGDTYSCDLNSPYTDFQSAAGTSASVQVFAGIMALVNQRHGRQGNANYVLYSMASGSGASCNSSTAPVTSSSCIFYDITAGNNSVTGKGGEPNCSNTTSGQYGIMVSGGSAAYATTAGYDLATGLGSVNAANLVNNWTSNFTTAATTLSLSTSPATNPITLSHGQPVNFTVNVTAGSGTPTGDVSLIAHAGNSASDVTGIGPFTLSAGSVSGSTVMLPGGSYYVTAHYVGNGTDGASDSTQPGIPVTVGKESSLTEVRLATPNAAGLPVYNVNTVPYGSVYFLRMDVTNSSGQLCAPLGSGEQFSISYACPTGSLTVSPTPTDQNPPSGTVAGSYILNSQGYAEDQPIQQLPGVYNFVASYAGDNSYTASTSPVLPVTITKAPTTVTFSTLSSPILASNIGLDVYVNTQSSGAGPTGTVQLFNNGVAFSSPQSVGASAAASGAYAKAVALIQSLPAGVDSITAQYSGDNNYAASSSAPLAVTVIDFSMSANPTTITVPAPGQSGTSTITFTPGGGFTGTISLACAAEGGSISCTFSPNSVNISGTSPVTTSLTVSTTGPASALWTAPPRSAPPSSHPLGRSLWVLAGLLLLATLITLVKARHHQLRWLFLGTIAISGVWAACGGGGGSSSPPPAQAALVSLSPGNLSFGQEYVSLTAPTQAVMLSNTGNGPLGISTIAIGGTNPTDFAQTNNCGASVAAGANCAINATFTPTSMGSRSASLAITDNASGSPQTVSLTGTGATPPVALSPTNLSFQANMNSTSPPQTVTLSNAGNTALNIASISFANYSNWFAQTNNCGTNVAAGANCAIKVTFAPPGLGEAITSLVVTDNASNSPQSAAVSGVGLPPVILPGSYWLDIDAASPPLSHMLQLTLTVQ